MADNNKSRFILFLLCSLILCVLGKNDDIEMLKEMMLNQQQRIQYLEEKSIKQEERLQHALKRVQKCELSTQDERADINKRQTFFTRNISFSTRLTTHVKGLGQHQAVVFDHVITNDGSGYRTSDGIFVVPTTGMYVFTWSTSTTDGKHQTTELVKEGTPYAYAYSDSITTSGDRDYGTASNTVVLKALTGEHVWVRTGTSGDGSIDGGNLDMFSGWLLYETE